MANVGYNLYLKMVKEEVMQTMGSRSFPEIETTVEMGEDAYIPDSYIPDEGLKLDMYRKVAQADTIKKAREVQAEFIDRFGPIPRPAANLARRVGHPRIRRARRARERGARARHGADEVC